MITFKPTTVNRLLREQPPALERHADAHPRPEAASWREAREYGDHEENMAVLGQVQIRVMLGETVLRVVNV